jgi:alkylhydroperoxidase family enzyme
MSRLPPVEPPYEPDVEDRLSAMMPPGISPILLFRTFVRNMPMAAAMDGWGRYELSKRLSLTLHDREMVIDRTTARCGCEYEWGVHVAFFAERAGLSSDQIRSLTCGDATDTCWQVQRDRLIIEAVDALHDAADVADGLWRRLAAEFSDAQLLDLLLLCGWYHAISFAANGARVPLEDGVPRFKDVA